MPFLASVRAFIAQLLHSWDTAVHSGVPLLFLVRQRWSLDRIPDQTGRVIIVTGGNSGIGYATSKALYDAGATVYLVCRSEKKALEAVDAIEKGAEFTSAGFTFPDKSSKGNARVKGRLEYMSLDLSDLNSINVFAREFGRRETRLDVLFANAGIMASPEGQYTKQGYTLQFGTNCLGHQRLISLLLPLLSETSRSSPSPARLIVSSSAGHSKAPGGGVDFSSLIQLPRTSSSDHSDSSKGLLSGASDNAAPPERGKNEHDKWTEYFQSKWGDVALARWVHWAYGSSEGRTKMALPEVQGRPGEVISVALHPGVVATNLAQHLFFIPLILRWAPWTQGMILNTPLDGAMNQLWIATCPDADARKLSGEYVVPWQRIGRARPDLDDAKLVEGVWRWCQEQEKKHETL